MKIFLCVGVIRAVKMTIKPIFILLLIDIMISI